MNLLPDMIIIDFCEWLKNIIHLKYQDIDFMDLMLDEQYTEQLMEYASRFLQRYKLSIKSVLHQYIESEYFDESLKKCDAMLEIHPDFQDEFYWYYKFTRYFLYTGDFYKSFHQFYKEIYRQMKYKNDNIRVQNVKPEELVRSSRFLFSHTNSISWIQKEKQWVVHFINRLDLDLQIEVDFLEWLIEVNSKPMDIRKMPLNIFERLAEQFQIECNKSEKDRDKLVKSFKYKDLKIISEKLLTILPTKTAKRAKDLGYIIERYQNKAIPFKCFIIPLQAELK